MDGIQACERIQQFPTPIRVVILSMHKDPVIVGKALRSGALGYVLKTSVSHELLLAVRAAVDGQRFLSSELDQEFREIGLAPDDLGAGESAFDELTPREREVLQLVAEGLTSRQIAETLHVSEKTIEKHRSHLMGKLGVHDVVGLVREAIRRKLVLFPE
jgi:DNA-binding NarL/FixJ family response regulator